MGTKNKKSHLLSIPIKSESISFNYTNASITTDLAQGAAFLSYEKYLFQNKVTSQMS